VTITASEQEQNIANALINGLANLPDVPTRDVVEEKAKKVAAAFDYTGSLENIITLALISVVTRMDIGFSLVDTEAVHDDQWVRRLNDDEWIYHRAYEGFLRREGWPPQMVHALSEVTLRILGHLQDPLSEGASWSRRGLVIGHVQSGKTANYTGIVARAADSGYKFIVVIAGIHNNLRKQTQERIDEAFIGRSSDPADRRPIGVGLDPKFPSPVTLTNIYADFNTKTAESSGWKLNDFSKPIIIIIKKNLKTLEALHEWLWGLNAREGGGRILNVPMLLIDDEADNASINTNKEDLDPTKTNAMIRRILQLFAKSCYVGYTATPFANIFINPDAYDEEVRAELFPKDFIYCLDAPTTYFGAEKVFLNDESSKEVVRNIKDAEAFIPFDHKGDLHVTELPPSFYDALYEFIVARAIRNLRGQVHKHCSFMINVSRYVSIQREVRNLLSLRVQYIREAVRLNYRMPEATSSRNEHMKKLRELFDREYSDAGYDWPAVKEQLNSVFDHFQLYVINSKSDEVLDFRKYSKDGVGLTAIAVGGLSLSRGLTIEGLTISYMYRNTMMYDTLMQMGRWFGYRPGYEDLCRVHLSPDSVNWYAHIARAAEELTQQIRRMRRDGMSPKQFGLYVLDHPTTLLVTAANKMRTGKKVVLRQNLSGDLVESYVVSTDPSVNGKNFELTGSFWKAGFGGKAEVPTRKGSIFRDVDVSQIEDFLVRFDTHSRFVARKGLAVDYLKAIAERYPLGDVLLISPDQRPASPHVLNVQERAAETVKGKAWQLNKDRVASRGDEQLGLSQPQLDQALAFALEDAERPGARKRKEGSPVAASDTHFRRVRNKPLLMIHSLSPKGVDDLKQDDRFTGPIAAFGISFPAGNYDIGVEIIANRVWQEQMEGPSDNPDDDEDYDE
jgi:hypothetical protein